MAQAFGMVGGDGGDGQQGGGLSNINSSHFDI